MSNKKVNEAGELLALVGLTGMGIVGAIIVAFLLFSLAMCIPATLIYLVLLYGFGGVYFVSFLNCWGACMILRIIGGLLLGGTSNNSN